MRLERLACSGWKVFEIAVMGISLEAIEGLRHAVQGCLGMALGFLQVSEIFVFKPHIVGVVGFHGVLDPVRSEQSGWGRCARLGAEGPALGHRQLSAKPRLIDFFDPAGHNARAFRTDAFRLPDVDVMGTYSVMAAAGGRGAYTSSSRSVRAGQGRFASLRRISRKNAAATQGSVSCRARPPLAGRS